MLAAMTSTGRQKLETGQESSETLLSMSTQIIISSFVFSFLSHIKQYKAVVVDSEEQLTLFPSRDMARICREKTGKEVH